MKKELIDKIKKFGQYLTDWKEKKEYYINEVLPILKDKYRHKEIPKEAKDLFLKIWQDTDTEEWNNIIQIIVDIKENTNNYLNQQTKEYYTNLFNILKEKYNFKGFIHTTSFENFVQIMKDGNICCRNYLKNNNIQTEDIALQDIIDRTNEKISDFVRMYWRVKNSTNYTNEGIKPKCALIDNYKAHSPNPVILIINPYIVIDYNCLFTDKNAGTNNFKVLSSPQSLAWDDIFHCNDEEWINLPELDNKRIKQARCAEILIKTSLSIKHITNIIFRSQADYNTACLEFGEDARFCIDEKQFYNNWCYIKNYSLKNDDFNIHLTVSYYFGNKFKYNHYNLFEFEHNIKFLDKNCSTIKNINIKDMIRNPYLNEQSFTFNNNIKYKYMCYYIDGIECMKVTVND